MKNCEEEINIDASFDSEQKAVKEKPPKESIEDCFNEYRLDDEVNALKYTLGINGESTKVRGKLKSTKRNEKDQGSVKDCLRPEESTPFQLLMAELKNTTMDSYWNKEVGKTRYQVPNLPAGMDPIKITFGKKCQRDGSVAEVINPSADQSFEKCSAKHSRILLKSRNDYYPSEQINREYEAPFNKFHRFGKQSGGNWQGKRIKKLMHWINSDPATKVSCLQADFCHTQPRVGEVSRSSFLKNAEAASQLMNCTFGKKSDKEVFGVSEILKESLPINPQLEKITKSLEKVNRLRIILKKRGVLFCNVEEELNKLDKENLKTVNINQLFDVFTKFKIIVEKESFCELLEILKLTKDGTVNYKEAINLLNLKCDFPELPKLEVLDSNYYSTTYNETIGNIQSSENSVKALRKESREKYIQSTMAAIITPNVFAQYGLSEDDLLKPYSKEELLSIFEKIQDFPKEKFDSIWEEGLKMDGTEGVCILTVKTLLDKFIAEMDIND